jgi:two-component system CheB/CheR fusion protein
MKTLTKSEREKALAYIDALLEVAREPFLILDKNLQIARASESFYQTFRVTKEETEKRFVYDLGNRQWNIPKLKELLEGILPERKVFKDFEVVHEFPVIGRRAMLLNARQVDSIQLIILAFEDITARKEVEKKAGDYRKKLEAEVVERTKTLASRVEELEKLTQVMVGRELKMSELKKEIARIKKL